MATKIARVITERQKKGTLASLKKTKRPQNVLVKNEIEYWPCLDENQTEELRKLLEVFVNEEGSVISTGLQSTLRKLNACQVKLLVLANEISPRWLSKHLIAMALSKNRQIKVLIVPQLKNLTKTLLKAPTIIFGVDTKASSVELDKFYQKLGIHEELLTNYATIESNQDVSIKKKKRKAKEPSIIPVTLLKKPADNSRAFIPMDVEEASQPPVAKPPSTGFIAFSTQSIEESKSFAKSAANVVYRPIKIKSMIGNPNRKKK